MQLTNSAWKDIKQNFYKFGILPDSFDENTPLFEPGDWPKLLGWILIQKYQH